MTRRPALPLLLLLAAGPSCGGGSPARPSSPPVGYSVPVVAFYDENGNGVLDPGEGARVPGLEVGLGTHTAKSDKVSGLATITDVPAGTEALTVHAETLPPFYQAPAAAPSVVVPPSANTNLPLALPIGSNTPNLYMGFGDSITVGDGSSTGGGYRDPLQGLLQGYFGRGVLNNQGIEGTKSDSGADRIGTTLRQIRPAYTLVLYGTNDWNTFACKTAAPCFTIDSLRNILDQVKGAASLPVLATIPPANPAWPTFVPERNQWVSQVNVFVRALAQQEGAPLADIEGAFLKAGGSDLSQLFSDHIHPNDRGYSIIADTFFAAITQPAGTGTTSHAVPSRPLPRGWSLAPSRRPPAPPQGW